MTQNFQPTINIHLPGSTPISALPTGIAAAPHEMIEPHLVPEDGMLWDLSGEKRTGPYCPTCSEADKKKISLLEGASRGVYTCPIHGTSFWTEDFRKQFRKRS
jgi:hypothetical protein